MAGASKPLPGFDFDALTTSLQTQQDLQTQRQQAELANQQARTDKTITAARTSRAVTQQSMQSADATRRKQLEVLSGVDTTIGHATEAMRLSDSQNPLDHLQLWALQQSDPTYTREGNLQRLDYLNQAAGAEGNVETVKQQGYADQLSGIKQDLELSLMEGDGKVDLLKMREQQGAEQIKSQQNAQAALLGTMQNQNSMQQAALSNMTVEQTQAAEQQAIKDGHVNIGGIDLSLAQITERKNQLQDRQYLMQVRTNEQQTTTLNNMTQQQVAAAEADALNSKAGTAVVDGVELNLARIQERKAALQSQTYQLQSQSMAVDAQADQQAKSTEMRLLQTFSVPELTQMIQNGGVDTSTGVKYHLDAVKAIHDTKAEIDANQTVQDMTLAQVGDPWTVLTNQTSYLKTIQAPPDSVLAQTVAAQQSATNVAASILTDAQASGDKSRQLAAVQIATASRATVDAAIADEAKKLSSNDKDLEIAYGYTLRGQPIPDETIRTAVLNKVAAGKPIGQWLSPPNRGLFLSVYNQELAKQAQTNIYADEKTRKQMAADAAFNAVTNQASGGITEEIMTFQLSEPGNPLNGVIQPAALLTMMRTADVEGAKQYQQTTGLKDADMQARMSGAMSDPQLDATQGAKFYQALEQKRPGLGQAYLDWWDSSARAAMVARYTATKAAAVAKAGFTQLSEYSMVMPSIPGQMSAYAGIIDNGQKQLYGSELAAQHQNFVTFGGDSAVKQAFLLEQDHGLTDIEKQQAMSLLIQPLVDQARANQMNADQASTFIEGQLKSMKPEDPLASKLLTKVLAGRNGALKVVDDYVSAFNMSQAATGSIPGIMSQLYGQATNPGNFANAVKGFGWYTEMQGGK